MKQQTIFLTNNMNRFKNILPFLAFFMAVSCSGVIDDGGAGSVPEGVLRIFADKSEISADGDDEVTFTVMYGSKDVSNEKTLQIIREYDGEKKYMPYGVNKFTTVTAGTYSFSAEFYYRGKILSDNVVNVEAEPFFSGDVKSYVRRFLGTLFTSTGCNSCPLAARGLKNLQEEFPGVISIAAFHADMTIPDPMTIQQTYEFQSALGGFTGLPAFFWNLREDSYTGGSYFKDSFLIEQSTYETYSGVAVSTSFDESTSELNIDLGITSNLPSIFRYLVIIVEDGIPATGEYEQNGQSADYIHYNVVRTVLTGVNGDKINDNLPLTVGVEVKASEKTVIPSEWNKDNLRVIVAAMSSEDGGYTWTANNVADCKAGKSVAYQYSE